MLFRKKPVVVDCVQVPTMWPHVSGVAKGDLFAFLEDCQGFEILGDGISIETLEGDMKANPGDWIIKGVKGEYYPCKPDIFAMTYEPA